MEDMLKGFEALKSEAVELIDNGVRSPVFLVCEHAGNRIPQGWGTLGLAEEVLSQHIGWDIGAAVITRALAQRFGATAVLARYSRLFMDCNRCPDWDDAVPMESDGVIIPGNVTLTIEEKALRQAIAFTPLHDQISVLIDRYRAHNIEPVLISIHSFTPYMNGVHRPWGIGVLWNECDRLGEAVANALQSEPGWDVDLVVGRNEPYSAKAFVTYTLETHGRLRGLNNIALEIRNDLSGCPESVGNVISLIERVLLRLMPQLARN